MGNNEIEILVSLIITAVPYQKVKNLVKFHSTQPLSFPQPDEIGNLEELTEIWLDSNLLANLPDVGHFIDY